MWVYSIKPIFFDLFVVHFRQSRFVRDDYSAILNFERIF